MSRKNLKIISGIATGLVAAVFVLKGTNLILKEKRKPATLLDKMKDGTLNLKDRVVKVSEKGVKSSKGLVTSLSNN